MIDKIFHTKVQQKTFGFIEEDETNYFFDFDFAKASRDNLEIEVSSDRLSLTAGKNPARRTRLLFEFSRSVDVERVSSTLLGGVVYMKLPKILSERRLQAV